MGPDTLRSVEYLVVDTTAFIQNAPLQDVARTAVTCQDVVDEIVNKRQLRRLVVLPYDLEVKDVFAENIKIVTDFAIKTGDYRSLSATDIKVIALTYQLEKEHVGVAHLRSEPVVQKSVQVVQHVAPDMKPDVTGFYTPGKIGESPQPDTEEPPEDINLADKLQTLNCDTLDNEDDDEGWITPSNVKLAKKQVNSELMEERQVKVACMTTDFAMQNVLKQMNLNVAALDGRVIKQLRTFILRCYACFKTTSIMTKQFCPKCGLNTLKKVAVSMDDQGRTQIHINTKRPLTARGKKYSLPRMRGGKHPNNPVLAEDAPVPQNMASKLARTRVDPLAEDYVAGYSPFAVRDVTSRSAQLCIRPGQDQVKHWMRKNPNEAHRRRK